MDLTVSPERRTGVTAFAREANWILDSRLMAFVAPGLQREYLRSSPPFDGVLSMITLRTPELAPLVKSLKVPTVDLWHDFPELKVPRVLLDHRAAGRVGAEHLLNLGLRSLLFYAHTVDRRVAAVRYEGFQDRCNRSNIEPRQLWWDPKLSARSKMSRVGWLGEQLRALPGPLGVLAVNDVVAAEVVDAVEWAGLCVPGDVVVLGVDNDPILTELGPMPLSSIDTARERLGYEAAALLDRLMRGEPPPTQPVLIEPIGVVPRRSTETLAVRDPEIARAARFIRDHFRERITVSDVAAHTFLSRRRLQDRFAAAIGHGMNEALTRQRVDFAKHLLTQTNHKISSVARLSGFTSVHRMAKVFQRILAITPQAYRRKFQPMRLQHHRDTPRDTPRPTRPGKPRRHA